MTEPTPSPSVSIAWTKAQPAVASYIHALVPDFHAAEDILQGVAVIVVKKYGEYDPAQPFLAWAIGIARFEVLHYRRSRARERVMFRPELMEQLAASFEGQEERVGEIRRAMSVCLERLTGRPREVFTLRYGEGLSVSDLARRLGMQPNTVSVSLHKSRRALRKCLAGQLGDDLWR